jgi:hypothetical protein
MTLLPSSSCIVCLPRKRGSRMENGVEIKERRNLVKTPYKRQGKMRWDERTGHERRRLKGSFRRDRSRKRRWWWCREKKAEALGSTSSVLEFIRSPIQNQSSVFLPGFSSGIFFIGGLEKEGNLDCPDDAHGLFVLRPSVYPQSVCPEFLSCQVHFQAYNVVSFCLFIPETPYSSLGRKYCLERNNHKDIKIVVRFLLSRTQIDRKKWSSLIVSERTTSILLSLKDRKETRRRVWDDDYKRCLLVVQCKKHKKESWPCSTSVCIQVTLYPFRWQRHPLWCYSITSSSSSGMNQNHLNTNGFLIQGYQKDTPKRERHWKIDTFQVKGLQDLQQREKASSKNNN